jgi:hypothetical protein
MTKKQTIFRKITAIIFAMAVAASLFTLVVSATSYTSTLYVGGYSTFSGKTRHYAQGRHEVDLEVDKINGLYANGGSFTMKTELYRKPSTGSAVLAGSHGEFVYNTYKTYYLPIQKNSIIEADYYYSFIGKSSGSLQSDYTILHTY